MVDPIKVEHAWGQLPAYTERVIHALPKGWQYGAFKVQKFLDASAPILINGCFLASAACTLFLCKRRATVLAALVLEGIFALVYNRCYPTLLQAKESQFIRGSKADVAVVALAIGGVLALWRPSAARGQIVLFGLLWLAERKHKNPVLETFEYVRGAFEQMGYPPLARQLETFKRDNPEASPQEILAALIQALKGVPDSCKSPLLEPLFTAVEKHRAFISKQELCTIRGSAKHVFLKERLRFIDRSLYEKEALSFDPPGDPASDSTKDFCIEWLKKPTHFPAFTSGEHAFEVCRLANYLGAKQLEEQATRYIAHKLEPDNFFSYFENARKYNLEALFNEGLKYLVRNAEPLLAVETFRVRLTALATTYKLGCISYLLNPRAYPNFTFKVDEKDELILMVNESKLTKLHFNTLTWLKAKELLTNCVNNGFNLRMHLVMYGCQINNILLEQIYQCDLIQGIRLYLLEQEQGELFCAAGRSLTSLSLAFSDPNNISFVPQSSHLQELKICHAPDLDKILEKVPHLKLLEVKGCTSLSCGQRFATSTLERLLLSDIAFTVETFAAFCQALESHPTLQRLDLGNCKLDEQSLKTLEKLLTKNPRLKVLTITDHGDERNQNLISYTPRLNLEEVGRQIPGRFVVIEVPQEHPISTPPNQLPNVDLPPPAPRVAEVRKTQSKPSLPPGLIPADVSYENSQASIVLYKKVSWWVKTQKDKIHPSDKEVLNVKELVVTGHLAVNERRGLWLKNRLNDLAELNEAIEQYIHFVQIIFGRK